MAHGYNHNTKHKDKKFKVILGYTDNLRLAWAIWMRKKRENKVIGSYCREAISSLWPKAKLSLRHTSGLISKVFQTNNGKKSHTEYGLHIPMSWGLGPNWKEKREWNELNTLIYVFLFSVLGCTASHSFPTAVKTDCYILTMSQNKPSSFLCWLCQVYCPSNEKNNHCGRSPWWGELFTWPRSKGGGATSHNSLQGHVPKWPAASH